MSSKIDHDHTDDCPDCALVTKIMEALATDKRHDPLAHLRALNIATLTILDVMDGGEPVEGNA